MILQACIRGGPANYPKSRAWFHMDNGVLIKASAQWWDLEMAQGSGRDGQVADCLFLCLGAGGLLTCSTHYLQADEHLT